jgi:hypothetical protein
MCESPRTAVCCHARSIIIYRSLYIVTPCMDIYCAWQLLVLCFTVQAHRPIVCMHACMQRKLGHGCYDDDLTYHLPRRLALNASTITPCWLPLWYCSGVVSDPSFLSKRQQLATVPGRVHACRADLKAVTYMAQSWWHCTARII